MRTSRLTRGILARQLQYQSPSLGVMTLVMMLVAASARAFECPVAEPVTDNVAIKETPTQIAKLSKALDADETGTVTEGTIFELKRKYPKATFAEIVNYMVTAYCPVVAKNDSLSDAERRNRLDRYAQQVEALAAK